MNKEDLFEGVGMLDERLLRRSERNKGFLVDLALKWGGLAACLAAAAVVWGNCDKGSGSVLKDKLAREESQVGGERQNHIIDSQPEIYIDTATLLASDTGTDIREQALSVSQLEIDKYVALYSKADSVESAVLQESAGSQVEGKENWYRISGHEDMQYLIFSDENQNYSLWKFEAFQSENYPLGDVLRMIYHIESARDIKEIISEPANMDNSDEGKAIQKEIGTLSVTDADDISEFYRILSGLTCYGGNRWDMIGLGDDTPLAMRNKVLGGRYLTLITSKGDRIASLKYTAVSGRFYEYGGVAYSALDSEEKERIEEILRVEFTAEGAADNPSGAIQDVPVEESGYQEAGGHITQGEAAELQDKITDAMRKGELPYVISSAIYENPDRVHVVISRDDEDTRSRLEALDTTGKALEIEYHPGTEAALE